MRLKEYLDNLGIAQSKFARKLGISKSTIHNIIEGKVEPVLATAIGIEDLTQGAVTCRELLSKNLPAAHKKKSS